MHTIEIPSLDKIFYLPKNLAECNSQQYIDMCALIFKYQFGIIDIETLKTNAVYSLLNLKRQKSHFQDVEENKMCNLLQIAELIKTFFEKEENILTINQNYTHNPIFKHKVLLTNYYGPQDSFMGLTFGEYADALRIFFEFEATKNVDLLFEMAAVLYREKKFFKTQKYNPKTVQERAEKFKNTDIGFIYGVYLFFASVQKTLITAKIPHAGKEIDLSILFQTDEQESKDDFNTIDNEHAGLGMDSIIFDLAESGVFGNFENVRNTDFWTVILKMYDLRVKQLQEKKLYDNNKQAS